jgi:hypothetical protein
VTEFGRDLLQKIKDMGIAIYDSSDPDIRDFMIKSKGRAATWFNGTINDAGPHTTTVLLGPNVNDAAIYEESLHVENGEARGWLGIMPPEAWIEEVEVETQVLSKADELGMTPAEREELQRSINTYRKNLYTNYGIVVL